MKPAAPILSFSLSLWLGLVLTKVLNQKLLFCCYYFPYDELILTPFSMEDIRDGFLEPEE